ncbi:MAG TPA: hypothetical protein VM370_09410 [Candidatus Thermoplasmatota archaeon]|nr:hypothetical protein [Candidatus Thermoplasmatota archaeon]
MRAPSQPPPEEEFDPGLLDGIPDVEATRSFPPAELHGLLGALEEEMHGLVRQEVARVEESVGALFADLEARLAGAQALVSDLREQNAQLVRARDRYDRAVAALKALADEDIDGTAL